MRSIRGLLFWWKAGATHSDRLKLLYGWLSSRFPRPEGPDVDTRALSIRTPYLDGIRLFLRPRSMDARVMRSVFLDDLYNLPSKPGQDLARVVDVGANVGITTLYFASRYPGASIWAIEPDPGNFACLRKNAESNPHSENIRAINACVTNETGVTPFSIGGPTDGRSISLADGGGIEIPTYSVGDLLDHCGVDKVDLLKMDIEGAEEQVFFDVGDWIHRVRWIRLEVHPWVSVTRIQEAVLPHGRRLFSRMADASGIRWVPTEDSPGPTQAHSDEIEVVVVPAEDAPCFA
ncbi:FkbM family methyltransferase [Gemmatimonadota bacterium]